VSNHVSMSYPDYKELLQGCAGYIEDEKRDAMYKLALRLVSEAKWKPEELAEGVGVLLLTWNAAFYTKYGSFDFDKLEDFIGKRIDDLKVYSNRSILSYSKTDDEPVQQLFSELVEAVKSVKREARTPVGTAKALHMLAPSFFSIWDNAIAEKYGVHWSQRTERASQLYARFQHLTKHIADNILKSYEMEWHVSRDVAVEHLCKKWHPRVAIAVYSSKPPISKSLTKMIDEYNYAKYKLKLNLASYRNMVLKILSSG